MKVSKALIQLLTDLEGSKTTVYRDIVGLPTIGVGHLIIENDTILEKVTGKPSSQVKTITEEQVHLLLTYDLMSREKTVNRNVKVALNQTQFDALVSFVFNIGSGNFATSKLLAKLNNHNFPEAAEEFIRWTKAGGKIVNGLFNRRHIERLLFVCPIMDLGAYNLTTKQVTSIVNSFSKYRSSLAREGLLSMPHKPIEIIADPSLTTGTKKHTEDLSLKSIKYIDK